MFNKESINKLISLVHDNDGCNNKELIENIVENTLQLKRERSVYTCDSYSVRFSKADSISFANVVISLSTLKKYDNKPFFVCVVMPHENCLLLANTFLIDKVSHSSQKLTMNNIKGSFLGSNIIREIDGIFNCEDNFENLYELHEKSGKFEGNLERIVNNTHEIVGTKQSITLSDDDRNTILNAVKRSSTFMESEDHLDVINDLKDRVNNRLEYIKKASKINNINIRGRLIEYIITAEEYDSLYINIKKCLDSDLPIPDFKTKDDLGDYSKRTLKYDIKADIKSELLSLSSNPKGYNVDKMLEFLSHDKSVFCLFLVGIDDITNQYNVKIAFCSMFDEILLSSTRIQHHWAGRGTRGVAQFDGKAMKKIVNDGPSKIDFEKALSFLNELIEK